MKKITIIAEVGVNHNGKINTAKKLIDLASRAKVDYVKFQSYVTDDLVTKNSQLAIYQKKKFKGSQNKLLKKYEMTFDKQKKLFDYCKKKKIKFLCTPFESKSLNFVKKHCSIIKVSSGDFDNIPFLIEILKTKKKIFLSTGMSDYKEIKKVLKILNVDKKNKNITLLYCHSDYPTTFEDLNLRSISFLKKKFGLSVGFSDHTKGVEASIAAAALGAEVIEKHFTLSKKMNGPDHSSSIDFNELSYMVKSIRNIEKGMGKFYKNVSQSEKKNKNKVRKSIVALKYIKKGEIFSRKNLTTKRPGNGILAINWPKFIGKKSNKNYKKDEQIKK